MWCRVYITTCTIEKDINFDKQIVREICLIRSTDVAPTEDNLLFYHNRHEVSDVPSPYHNVIRFMHPVDAQTTLDAAQ